MRSVIIWGVRWDIDRETAGDLQQELDDWRRDPDAHEDAAIVEKYMPGASGVMQEMALEYHKRNLRIGKVVVKGHQVRPYPEDNFEDPMPFEYVLTLDQSGPTTPPQRLGSTDEKA